MEAADRLPVHDLTARNHREGLPERQATDLGDDLVVLVRRALLSQVLRQEQVDTLVGESRRREDGGEMGEPFGAQAGLLEQLASGTCVGRLARVAETAGRGLPDVPAGAIRN